LLKLHCFVLYLLKFFYLFHLFFKMPQLDVVSFPSQVFWLVIFFFVFYSFVAGHFVPLLHKIIQTRSKKVSMSQDVASGQSDAHSSVISKTEGLVLGTLDKAISGLNACTEEVTRAQNVALLSGDKAKVAALAKTVASIQGRYLVSRGSLSFVKEFLVNFTRIL
jgi:F-type H+-transporting ATPase subunit b